MLTMTDAARKYLSTVLERSNAPDGTAVRFDIEGDTLTSRVDVARPGDATFDHDGRKVLVMDQRVSQLLDGTTLDLQPTTEGDKLVLVH